MRRAEERRSLPGLYFVRLQFVKLVAQSLRVLLSGTCPRLGLRLVPDTFISAVYLVLHQPGRWSKEGQVKTLIT